MHIYYSKKAVAWSVSSSTHSSIKPWGRGVICDGSDYYPVLERFSTFTECSRNFSIGRVVARIGTSTGQCTGESCRQENAVQCMPPPPPFTLLWALNLCAVLCSKSFLFLPRRGSFEPLTNLPSLYPRNSVSTLSAGQLPPPAFAATCGCIITYILRVSHTQPVRVVWPRPSNSERHVRRRSEQSMIKSSNTIILYSIYLA